MSVTGENEQGLRKIIDLTRFASIFVLLLHIYFYCYGAFVQWGLRSEISDRLLQNIANTGLFSSALNSKALSVGLLVVSLLGWQGRKDEQIRRRLIAVYLLSGLVLFVGSDVLLHLALPMSTIASAYMVTTVTGFLLILAGGSLLSRLVRNSLQNDVFNHLNETFPQEERFLGNEYSINLSARYNLKGKQRKSWINIINPFRGLLVIGSPGAGKSWFVIQHVIKQHIEKGFAMFVYDFKYDDLSKIAYNWLQRHKDKYAVPPSFYVINFDNLSQSHRCNPLDPQSMNDITDATESARTILLGLNREWVNKQGDFFVESPINFLTAVIWFLRKYEDGKYCTLPHVIELMQTDYEELFPVLNTEPEIEVLVNPFITAYQNDAMEQLEGQVASAKIGMARLASPQLYWVLSGNDFTLDINNPEAPKIVCMANNPEKQQIYGAVLSLYISRLVRQVNKKDRLKCSLVFDEFPTIYFGGIDSLIATARSNKVATTLAMQDFSQLKKDYGREQADVIVNIAGNIISGQVMGETAKVLSERFGKIMQDRQSVSINRTDTSISHSKQLDSALPASKIASLSSGEFVGMVADNPYEKISLKIFHSEVLNNYHKPKKENSTYINIPIVSSSDAQSVGDTFYQIKIEIKKLVQQELKKIQNKNQALD
ncbi:conjugal transfer protein MobC [Flavisolibacter nicotianae]|uniref:conjugal transfer protein MobC n=1 Tax=Flavisolibacter nicotianae TaxID=2364882 RepID=UPI000EB31542|nr:conjugal transfer protein MobC [Flavisolibacter nicotianae]